MLPPGQKSRTDFPRFGLPPYAQRFPTNVSDRIVAVTVNGGAETKVDIGSPDHARTSIQSDFHCVTTWSYVGANWGGVSFSEFYQHNVKPLVDPETPLAGAILYGQDAYKTTLILEDLLADGVLLADSLDGQPLPVEHGAPLRLVAPEHYGYKNLKHLKRIEFYSKVPVVKRGVRAFLDHPRARVGMEERGRWIPGWILRYVYRPLVSGTVKDFSRAMGNYKGTQVNE